MAFVELVSTESYRMRSSAAYPGDLVQRRVRSIGGKRFEFTRIVWGDGSVTVRAYEGDAAEPFREWTRCGMWTDPVWLGEGSDCHWLAVDPEHCCPNTGDCD